MFFISFGLNVVCFGLEHRKSNSLIIDLEFYVQKGCCQRAKVVLAGCSIFVGISQSFFQFLLNTKHIMIKKKQTNK